MNVSEIKQLLETEVPAILQESPGFKEWLQDFIRRQTVSKESFDERFDRIMNELAAEKEIRSISTRQEQSIGALGARWGLNSEASFRAALKGILEDSFGVQVLNVNEFDDEGIVFGRPDQVELDIIVKNGTLILCELKSSMSKGDMYVFERKVRFYEKRHQRSADRMIVISPMVDAKAQQVAKALNIEVFSYSDNVTGLA